MSKCLILCSLIILVYTSASPPTYGPHTTELKSVEGCKGPKRKNCTDVQFEILNNSKMRYHIHVMEDTAPTKGKVIGIGYGNQTLTLLMKSLCSNLFLRAIVQKAFNVTKDCVVLKGYYDFTVDIQELAQNYQGDAFFYGEWTFKSVFFNDKCNFNCLVTKFLVSPRKREVKKHV